MNFTILNINPGTVHTPFMEGAIDALNRFHYRRDPAGDKAFDPFLDALVLTHSGPYLDDGRNKAVERGLAATQSDVYLFIDSDVHFTNTDILNVLSHDFAAYPVICGSYRNVFQIGWSPVVYTHRSLDPEVEATGAMGLNPIGDDGWHLLGDTDDEHLKTCHVSGAGFMAISRDLLTKLGEIHGKPCPWFAEAISQDRTHLGEDTTFCLRVLELGFPICIDTRVKLTHTKSIAISGKAD